MSNQKIFSQFLIRLYRQRRLLKTEELFNGFCFAALCRTLWLLAFFTMAVLVGCQPGGNPSVPFDQELEVPREDSARLSLFFALKKPNVPGIRLEVSSFEVLTQNNWLQLNIDPLTIDSEIIKARQLFLGGQWVTPGSFETLRFSVTQSSLLRSNGEYEPVSTEPYIMELNLTEPLQLFKNDSKSLFITWDVQASIDSSDNLRPVMTIAPPVRQLFADLVFVACPDIDTVFIIRSDNNWVADSFGLKGRPTYMALDPEPSSQLLYVLAARESSIKVVELNSQRVIDTYAIPLVENSTFMTISPDGQSAYVLSQNDNFISRLDLSTGELSEQVSLGYQPQYATYIASRNLLAVSYLISQTVSLRNPLDLSEISSVRTGDTPDGLLEVDSKLYIAESGANTISVLDVFSYVTEAQIVVGFSPRRILNIDGKIYVSNYENGSLSVIYPGQLGVGREIPGLGKPLEMVYNQMYHSVYVSDEQHDGLAVIDSTTNQLKEYINLGTRPLGLVIIQ